MGCSSKGDEDIHITILGSTGSIGTQTLEVIEELCQNGGDFAVFALGAKNNIEVLEAQARKFGPEFCAVYEKEAATKLKARLADTGIKVLDGIEGLNFIASHPKPEYVVNALIGQVGLEPTLAAINVKKNIGLANKETLVVAGEIVMREAASCGAGIIPIDGEHCAIAQCLVGEDKGRIEKLILTASGGPFFKKTKAELKKVTLEEALRHPTWKMGKKITVDCATLMNKGLEIIEACHLFSVSPDDIEIIIHRESVVHSLVQFIDKSQKAQLSVPDMKMCIQYALTCQNGGKRERSACKALNLTELKSLSFESPDDETFIFPNLARFAMKEGGALPAAMNAANEAAVELFLKGKIGFADIFELVENTTLKFKNIKNPVLSDIIDTMNEVKNEVMLGDI